jgi:hypothetical protein
MFAASWGSRSSIHALTSMLSRSRMATLPKPACLSTRKSRRHEAAD